MECFFPGRVLIGQGPGSDGTAYLAELLTREFGGDFEIEFGIDDVLRKNELKLPEHVNMRTLPFVGRVPEGAELEMSSRLRNFPRVASSTPDYLVYPNAPITIDDRALNRMLRTLGARPASNACGSGCTVGILDSGVDPTLVPHANLHLLQYDALAPENHGATPTDQIGHGSIVARIVSTVAPAANILSVKTFDRTGTISSVLAALYLAQAAGPCDVINLSMSISCMSAICGVCHTPQTDTNIQQLNYFFQNFMNGAPDTVLVAAAGNKTSHMALPAAFDRVISVGSFDYANQSALSAYHQVPADRYVLAPGGQNAQGQAYASRLGISRQEYLHGTSFAAAFISGFAAKVICNLEGGMCAGLNQGQPMTANHPTRLANVLGAINANADTHWLGYDPIKHGLGAIYF